MLFKLQALLPLAKNFKQLFSENIYIVGTNITNYFFLISAINHIYATSGDL
jgi:hypothetical protein